MCNRNSPQKSKSNMGCVRETPQIKKKIQHGMCKGNSQYKNEPSTMWKRNSPEKEEKNEASSGCVRETPHKKVNPTWDV